MAAVLWKPEVNALPSPQSYSVRYLPKDTKEEPGKIVRSEKTKKVISKLLGIP